MASGVAWQDAPMDITGFLDAIDSFAPWAIAEEWDNVGLIVGRRAQPVRRVIVALDLRRGVLDEALATGADTILVHHPPIFPAIGDLTDRRRSSELVLFAAESRIAVIAAHTNLDSAVGGLNDRMAELLGITGAVPLLPASETSRIGLGRIGDVAPQRLAEFVLQVRAAIGGAVTWAGDPEEPVLRVACCTGSGGGLVDEARNQRADVFVTSDLKYHDADRADALALVSVPHGQIEAAALAAWCPTLADAVAPEGVQLAVATHPTDPWELVPPATL
jgi:dinuclear metal center YbgI/SA1388 family protein